MSALTASQTAAVLAASRYVLLDFDGPVCSIFAGGAAAAVANELAKVIEGHGVAVPTHVLKTGDPLEALRHVGPTGGVPLAEAERMLRSAELGAAETATPTPGSAEFLHACNRTGRAVAIVSNNSAPAVMRYLERVGLNSLVAHVEGRIAEQPSLMKPHRALVDRACRAIGALPTSSVLIGDSATDLEAALAAGVPFLGYANRPGKAEALSGAGGAVVGSMVDLAALVFDTPAG